jgi:hypothetical protein
MRMAGAEPVQLSFKVFLCIEGVPNHSRQASIIRKLLPKYALLEYINYAYRSDNEAKCCCVIMWSRDPDNIPKEAAIRLEELQDRSSVPWHFTKPEAGALYRPHAGLMQTLSYEVILHIDQICGLPSSVGGLRILVGAPLLQVAVRLP